MIIKILSFLIGLLICIFYSKFLLNRKTIVLNSSKMVKLNNNIIKIDNRCFKKKSSNKCDK